MTTLIKNWPSDQVQVQGFTLGFTVFCERLDLWKIPTSFKYFWIFQILLDSILHFVKMRINLSRESSDQETNMISNVERVLTRNILKINLRWDGAFDSILWLRLVIIRAQCFRNVQKVQRDVIENTLAAKIEIHKIVFPFNWIHRRWIDKCSLRSCQVQRYFSPHDLTVPPKFTHWLERFYGVEEIVIFFSLIGFKKFSSLKDKLWT